MSAINKFSKVLGIADGVLFIRCPACDIPHGINIERPNQPQWSWNGNAEQPTFTPSLLVTRPVGPLQLEQRCHSMITNGQIQFLGDCTHALANCTVDIPEWETD